MNKYLLPATTTIAFFFAPLLTIQWLFIGVGILCVAYKPKLLLNGFYLPLVGLAMCVSIWLAPQVCLIVAKQEICSAWQFISLAYVVVAYMYACVVYEYISRRGASTLYVTFAGVVAVMALYMIYQALLPDQLYTITNHVHAPNVPANNICATFGHPMFAASWLALFIPMLIVSKQYVLLILVAVALLLTRSQMGIGSAVVGVVATLIHSSQHRGRWLIWAITIGVIATSSYFIFPQVKSVVGDGGRFKNFAETFQHYKKPFQGVRPYTLTGRGLGSYRYLYASKDLSTEIKTKAVFRTAHNEYLQILYELGAFGLVCFLMMVWSMVHKAWITTRPVTFGVLAVALSNIFGTFSLQRPEYWLVLIVYLVILIEKPDKK